VAFPIHVPAIGLWAMADAASRKRLTKSFMEGLDSLCMR
jgi:hypothetical protein